LKLPENKALQKSISIILENFKHQDSMLLAEMLALGFASLKDEMAKAEQRIEVQIKNTGQRIIQRIDILSSQLDDTLRFQHEFSQDAPFDFQFPTPIEDLEKLEGICISEDAEILLVSPLFLSKSDPLLTYQIHLFGWGDDVRKAVLKTKHRVISLCGKYATKSAFEYSLENNPSIEAIIYYGYGNSNALIGFDDDALVNKDNIDLLSGKLVYTIGCYSVNNLGEMAVENGVKSYFGYSGPFYISTLDDMPMRICANAGIIAMLTEDCDARKAIELMTDKYRQWIRRYEVGQDNIADDWFIIAGILKWNLSKFTAF